MEEKERFTEALAKVLSEGRVVKSIGTYSESTLHSVLKTYYEPDSNRQELKIGKYCADIVSENGVIEIQTRKLFLLKGKLDAFLPISHVTVVHPISEIRNIIKCNDSNGEIISKRKSPRKGRIYDVIDELLPIRNYISHPNFELRVCMLETDDYKIVKDNGKAVRVDRIPQTLISEISFTSPSDYSVFLPEKLPEKFTSTDIAKQLKIRKSTAQGLLCILNDIDIVERIGRKREGYIYVKVNK